MKESFRLIGVDRVKDDTDADGLTDEFGEIDDFIVGGEAFDAKAEELRNPSIPSMERIRSLSLPMGVVNSRSLLSWVKFAIMFLFCLTRNRGT